MKYGTRKFWIDPVKGNWCRQVHIRWEQCMLHDNNYATRGPICRQLNPPASVFAPAPMAVFHDAIGCGVEWLPQAFELWYNSNLRRLCISLWLIAFWFDFSSKPFFRKLRAK